MMVMEKQSLTRLQGLTLSDSMFLQMSVWCLDPIEEKYRENIILTVAIKGDLKIYW